MKIYYNIDQVFLENNNIVLRGWVFCERKKIDIHVLGAQKLLEKINLREDVKKHFKTLEVNENCGFELHLQPNSRQIKIKFKTDCDEIEIDIDFKKLKRERLIQRAKKMQILAKKINTKNIVKGLRYLNNNGLNLTVKKIKRVANSINEEPDYNEWFLTKHIPNKDELDKQKNTKFNYNPKISIVTPTFNTPKQFLIEMIESVREQTYSNWELCLADGASTNVETIKLLKEYEKKDKRIKVKYLDRNLMISGNTNEALTLATGEYIGLFDHDDLLTPNCLFEVVKAINEDKDREFIYTDEDKTDENTKRFFGPHFKQNWAEYTLRSYNYITHFSVFSKKLLDEIGVFRSEFDGSQDYDIILRLTEKAKKVHHIPKILYHWRVHKDSVASGAVAKPYAYEAAKMALKAHLDRLKIKAEVKDGLFIGAYKINYEIKNESKISIIIPNKDHKNDLEKCLNSILTKTTYLNYEIIIVENNSETDEIFDYYKKIQEHKNITVVKANTNEFNYSYLNNLGVKNSKGEYIVLLNNDTEIITPNWLEEMLMLCQQSDVGVVGAKLYYEDNTIQHAGVYLGIGGIAAHLFEKFNRGDHGPIGRLSVIQNVSAVTGACLMTKKVLFNYVKCLDENLFKVAYNDIDYCLKIKEIGKKVVWSPFVELYHYESKTRGLDSLDTEKMERLLFESNNFKKKWGETLKKGDPYYNINLSLEKSDFSLRVGK